MTTIDHDVSASRPAAQEPTPQPTSSRYERRSQVTLLAGLGHVALALWALLVLVPIAWTFLSSLKTGSEIFGDAWTLPKALHFDNFGRAWTKAHIGKYMFNSVLVVGVSTFGTMLLGSMAAYVLARYKFFGNRVIYYLFVSGLAFPVFLAITPLFFAVRNMGRLPVIGPWIGLDTRGGLILVYIAYSLPFTVFFLAAFFKTLPDSIAEAAIMDGASHTRLFFRVMLPMARSGIVSITIFNILGQWNQYLLPVALLQGQGAEDRWVLTQGIANISTSAGYESDWPALFAALTLAILPMIIMYAIFQRQIQAGLTAGALK
jgi:N-acetylglucosamine transport system permease protein